MKRTHWRMMFEGHLLGHSWAFREGLCSKYTSYAMLLEYYDALDTQKLNLQGKANG